MNIADNFIPRIVIFLLFFCSLTCSAQVSQKAFESSNTSDSIKTPSKEMTRDLAGRGLKQSEENFREHQVVLKQNRNFFLIKNEIEETKNFLRKGFNYSRIRREISQLIQWKELSIEGVITHKDSIQTVRNLATTYTLLNELLNRTNGKLNQILTYQKSLGLFQYRLDSLAMDSALYQVPDDSVSMVNYFQKLQFLIRDLKPVNKELKAALDSMQNIEIQVNKFKFDLESVISGTEALRARLFEQFNTNELENLGQTRINDRPVWKIISYSMGKTKLVLLFYVVNHSEMVVLILLFIAAIYFYLVMLKRKVSRENVPQHLIDQVNVLRNPLAFATLLVLTVFPVLLPMPPFVLNGLIWIICAASLTVMIRKSVSRSGFVAWIFFILLFLLSFLNNLILRHSTFERLSMLFLSVSGLAAGIFILVTKKRKEIKEKIILVSIGIMIILQLPAIYYNITGGFNLAKIFMTIGLFVVTIAFLVYWTARFLSSVLRISYYFYHGSEGEKLSLTDEIGNIKVPGFYYVLFFAGWFILIGRDFFFYQTIIDPFRNSLAATRTIGEFSFNYKSILVFFLVLILSAAISQVVSFLASENTILPGKPKKSRLGSWLVLIRITLITAGVLVAFIAAGIPMDRFAFILGAMSVGIGFGLQSLVNNLISGLVIAFEKPVNVGDIVEFGGRTGTMKSIGIRSSVITTLDGADVIIPNGDLLNQHLVNWTLGNSRRRFDLVLNVSLGSDLELTKNLLVGLMLKDERILKDPLPIVLVNKFDVSSVELILRFWASHFDIGREVKSDLIPAIEALFYEQGLTIPFPRQEVHIIP